VFEKLLAIQTSIVISQAPLIRLEKSAMLWFKQTLRSPFEAGSEIQISSWSRIITGQKRYPDLRGEGEAITRST
jgi:hypothetical protein